MTAAADPSILCHPAATLFGFIFLLFIFYLLPPITTQLAGGSVKEIEENLILPR